MSSTDPQGGALTYAWDFGDAASAAGASASHAYAAEGAYNVSVKATSAGGLSATGALAISVVALPPAVPVMSASNTSPTPGAAVDFTGGSTDPQGSPLTYSWDFKDGATATGPTQTHSYPDVGTYPVALVVTNGFNKQSSASIRIVVTAQPPVILSLTPLSARPKPNDVVAFAVTAADPQGTALSYGWDFKDGSTATGATASHAFRAQGDYPVSLAVRNTLNEVTTTTIDVNVVAQAPLILSLTPAIAQPKPTDSVTFAATASDPQNSALSFSWDFKDGTTAAGATVTHAYETEGTRSVSLAVSDAFGKSTTAISIVNVIALAPLITGFTASTTQAKPNETVSFSASTIDPQTSALTYHWDFGDGASAATADASHAWAAEGAVSPTLTVTNAFAKSVSKSATLSVVAQAPSVPVISVVPGQPAPGQSVTLAATSSDPQGSALTYQWNFGDGAASTGANVTHIYGAVGAYPLAVTATNTFSKSASSTASLAVDYGAPSQPLITPAAVTLVPNQAMTFTAQSVDPGGFAITYAWDFGDGASAGNSATQSHSYAGLGNYTVTATVTNSVGKVSTTSAAVVVNTNPFETYCAGPNCGAIDPLTYSGSGIGIWRYDNTTASPATVHVSISGISAGRHAIVLFSNGHSAATSVPFTGVLASPTVPPALALPRTLGAASLDDIFLASHADMLARNKRLTDELVRTGPHPAPAFNMPQTQLRPLATPTVGATRTWVDYNGTAATTYTAAVVATCAVPSGRNVVFWVDPTLTGMPASELTTFQTAFCGAGAGYDRTTSLIGDVWGPTIAAYQTVLIQDAPALQDVNIVFLNVPPSVGWGGYFFGFNNYQSSANQALAFFINGPNSIGNQDYYVSTLIHELTHMINFYQRAVAHGVSHDTWLEETSAMMSEDIVAPAISPTGFNDIRDIRTRGYFLSGGNVSLITWQDLGSSHYALGGSFGAFLNRRYGVPFYQQVSTCGEAPATAGSSFQCIDALVQGRGGAGYSDEFARFGASLFGSLGSSGVPVGYGYPAVTSGGYALEPFPLPNILGFPPGSAAPLGSTLGPTSQTYVVDTIANGSPSYTRTGISVPANSTLMVIVE